MKTKKPTNKTNTNKYHDGTVKEKFVFYCSNVSDGSVERHRSRWNLPASRWGQEVQGNLWHLHLPSVQTYPADLWGRALHHLPGTRNKGLAGRNNQFTHTPLSPHRQQPRGDVFVPAHVCVLSS